MAVDTQGHLLAAVVTPANEPDRAQVAALCERVQQVTGQHVQAAYVDQSYMGEDTEYAAAVHDIALQVIAKSKDKLGLCCCHANGLSSAASSGPLASAA